MSDNTFAEQIRKTAEALQELYRVAREEEKKAVEERNKERAKRKAECSAICQRVLLPTMKLFAMGLEAAKVFTPQCWKVDYEPYEDKYCCMCWARLPRTEASGKAAGIVVRSSIAMTVADDKSPHIRVQVKCCQASPGDWKEIAALPMSEPSNDVPETYIDDLYSVNSSNLDDWHKQRLEDCAKACADWLEQHHGAAIA
jgi:hypothetical protein